MARLSAAERRTAVLAAAVPEFAAGGLAGTSTEAIARRAGISQPYLFRLFPTKLDLFVATVRQTFERMDVAMAAAAEGLSGNQAFAAMGECYLRLLGDRELLLGQLQAYAASDDPEVREATRTGFRRLWQTIERATGASPPEVTGFVAQGMLLNVVAALELPEINESWARSCSVLTDQIP